MRTFDHCILGLTLSLAACSSTRLALAPIENRQELPLTYRTGWESGSLEAGPVSSEVAPDAPNATAARVRVTFVHLSTAESEALFGPIGARPAALEVTPADAQRLLDSVQAQSAERVIEPGVVSVASGQPGELRVSKQCAYVAAFELSQTPEARVADPIVQVIEDGYLLRLSALSPAEDGAAKLGVELVSSDLERPMREHVIHLSGSSLPVTVQEPACLTQRLQTSAALSDTRALLLAGIPAREAGRTLLVVLRRER